jgi:predicted aspartyl protease
LKNNDFLSRYLGGIPFLTTCTLSFNGYSLITSNALVDTGANGYLFVNMEFGRKLDKLLGCEEFSDFDARAVGGFDGSISQTLDLVLRAHLTVQNRTINDEWLIVIDSNHDIIIGQKWLECHDVLTDSRRRRLLFPPSWQPDPAWKRGQNLVLSQEPLKQLTDADHEDIRRRDRLMEQEDRRRRDGRSAIKKRIAELEQQQQQQQSLPNPAQVPAAPKKVTILPRAPSTPILRTAAPCDEGVRQMQRALWDVPPTPPPSPRRARTSSIAPTADRPHRVAVISAIAYRQMSLRRKGHAHASVATGITTLHEIDRVLEQKTALAGDDPGLRRQALAQVPKQYHDFLDVFSKADSDELPPLRPGVDHKIELLPDA